MQSYIKNKNVGQFIKFSVVGFSNTVIGYLIYVISLLILHKLHITENYDIYIAQFIMYLLSVLWSFYWNSSKVFIDKKESFVFSLLKTYISYAFTSLFLSEVLLYLWTNVLNLNKFIAPLFSLLFTVPLNYYIHKVWVFREK